MRLRFDLPEYAEHAQFIVSRDELDYLISQLIATKFNFEVVDLEDGNFVVEYRTKNDNDVCIIKEYHLSSPKK